MLHSGGPALNLSRVVSRSTWEVFNEAEHHYTPETYTNDYDRLVEQVLT